GRGAGKGAGPGAGSGSPRVPASGGAARRGRGHRPGHATHEHLGHGGRDPGRAAALLARRPVRLGPSAERDRPDRRGLSAGDALGARPAGPDRRGGGPRGPRQRPRPPPPPRGARPAPPPPQPPPPPPRPHPPPHPPP